MIVEFVGCTGAGKTTLISQVQRKLAAVADVSSAFEVVARPLRLDRVTHPTAQNLIQEVMVLPHFARLLHKHRDFLIYAVQMLARQRTFTLHTTSYLRSLERAMGVHEIIRQREHNSIVLVDEGTVLLAHNLFVYSDAVYTSHDIINFGSLAPLPDLIVYIRAPIDRLIERTLSRSDPPREMRARNRLRVERYIHRAVTMFDQLIEAPQIRSRILLVNNEESTNTAIETTSASIVAHIMDYIGSDRSFGHLQITTTSIESEPI